MKKIEISSIDYYVVGAGWRDWLFLEIRLRNGLVGFSEFTESNGSIPTLLSAIEEIKKDVITLESLDVANIVLSLRRKYRQSIPGVIWKAISAFENALWDLKSKSEDQTIPQILQRLTFDSEVKFQTYWSHCPTTRIRSGEFLGKPKLSAIEDLAQIRDEIDSLNFQAFKTNLVTFEPEAKVLMPGFNKNFSLFRDEISKSYGEELDAIINKLTPKKKNIDCIIDLNFNVSPLEFKLIQDSISDQKIRWIEIDFDDINDYEQVLNSSNFPICTGENILGHFNYNKIIEDRRVGIVSIDILWNGLSESLKIAEMAIAKGKKIAVHNYYGSLASSIALVFMSMLPKESIELLEYDYDDVPWRDYIFETPPLFFDGNLRAQIGLGWNNNLIIEKMKMYEV
jgi:galactonate dehydratase